MRKAIIIIVFFCSLFITKDVFALEYLAPYKIDTYNGYQYFVIKSPINASGWYDSMLYSAVYSIDENASLYGYRLGGGSFSSLNQNDLTYSINEDLKGLYDINDSFYRNASYGNKIRVFMCNSRFVSGQGVLCYGDDFNIETDFSLNYLNTTGYYYFDLYINTGSQPSLNDILSPAPAISSITPSYPVNTTIQPPENLNQTIRLPVTLTGSYTNIDEYNYILVYGLDEGILGREYVLCESDIGESGDYSCSVDFWTNKTYNYEMIMTKTPAPSSPSVSSGVKSFSIGEPFISSNDFLTSNKEECDGYTDIYCHLKNAFRWGFIPSKATFYKFVSLSNKIMERAPFGYAKIIYQKLENLQIDETNNLELVSLEAIDEMIYSPFRVAFSYILYFIFVVGLYFRFRNINI